MRAFIVLCLFACARADKLGYNYRPVEHSNAGLSFTPGSNGASASHGVSSLSGPVSYGGAPASQYTKEYYTFIAPDDAFDDADAAQQIGAALKKRVRVIFIKAPENRGYENAVLALAKQAAEQQTAIYVLHKQPDIAELANKFNAVRSNKNNRPEVHFVKYRTPEDAANAQQAIQSQYDQLGGSSQSHNGSVAPVINFASQPSLGTHGAAVQTPASSYLPASILRRLRRRK